MNSREEFPEMSIEDVQKNFFLGNLINDREGLYYFRKTGMNTSEDSLVLSQFDNLIIASANLQIIESMIVQSRDNIMEPIDLI
ncbi:hypothetical protein [Niallia sp. Marseille-Q9988]